MLFIPSLNMSAICFFCFIIAVFFICTFMLLIGFLLGGRSVSSYSKNVPFESGINSIGNARLRFSIKFYLVGMFFVVFDAEALYLYIWSIVIRESGWFGLIEILIFICFLLLGLIYLIDMDVLQWKNSRFLNKRK